MRQNAGDPQAVRDALDGLDVFLWGRAPDNVVDLRDPARDAAWAELGG